MIIVQVEYPGNTLNLNKYGVSNSICVSCLRIILFVHLSHNSSSEYFKISKNLYASAFGSSLNIHLHHPDLF